jgi:hypothetical protein
VRSAAAQALGAVPKDNPAKSNAVIEALIGRLGDIDSDVRSAAAQALGAVPKDNPAKSNAVIEALIGRLGDTDSDVRSAAAQALSQMPSPIGAVHIAGLLGLAADRPLESATMEADFDILTGGKKLSLLLPVLRRAQPEAGHYNQPDDTLALFAEIWPGAVSHQELRQQIAWHSKNIVEGLCVGGGSLPGSAVAPLPRRVNALFAPVETFSIGRCYSQKEREQIAVLSALFAKAHLPEQHDLDRMLRDDIARDRLVSTVWWAVAIVATHTGLWVALLWLYPRYTWVQAVFFWNPAG